MTMKKSCDNLHCNRPNTFMFDFIGNKTYWKCPFDAKCMDFNVENIMSRLQTVVNEQKESEKEIEPPQASEPVGCEMCAME